ncbi:Protease [Pyrenophora tritici-repentis]|nr:Protease [Pyrenophora tritici-repentis]
MTEVHFVSSASIGGKPSKDFSRQLEFPGSALTRPDCWQPISTLIDTGASACFVNQSWVNQHRLDTMPVAKPIRLSLANGGEVDKLTQAVDLPVRHGSHTHNVLCYVTNIGKYDVILGMNGWTITSLPSTLATSDHSPSLRQGANLTASTKDSQRRFTKTEFVTVTYN